jgi:hypothetical protein
MPPPSRALPPPRRLVDPAPSLPPGVALFVTDKPFAKRHSVASLSWGVNMETPGPVRQAFAPRAPPTPARATTGLAKDGWARRRGESVGGSVVRRDRRLQGPVQNVNGVHFELSHMPLAHS